MISPTSPPTNEQLYGVIVALEQRISDMDADHSEKIGKLTKRAACKTLMDSERRKNTQASNDVRARQLVRF